MPKADELIAAYIKLRDKKEAMDNAHKELLKPLVAMMDEVAAGLLHIMQTVGTSDLKGDVGTAYRTLKTSATVEDKEAFRLFCTDGGHWELADLRASKKAVEDYKTEHGELPPGIKWSSMYDVNVRRK